MEKLSERGVPCTCTPQTIDSPELKEACGVFACSLESPMGLSPYLEKGLKALQHRGEDGSGLVYLNSNNKLTVHKTTGLVQDLFEPLEKDNMTSHLALGHVRYGTSGKDKEDLVQPLVKKESNLAIAFNGQVETRGCKSDTARLLDLFATFLEAFNSSQDKNVKEQLIEKLTRASSQEAFSVVALHDDFLYAYRDENGTRPLFMADVDIDGQKGIVLASETCAFNQFEVSSISEISPGGLVILKSGKVVFDHAPQKNKKLFCAFEALYFSREDSLYCQGKSYYDIRKEIGCALARTDNHGGLPKMDLVIGVPQSGMPAALGYARQLGVPLEFGLIKSRYQGRSFIQPSEDQRKRVLEEKLQVQASVISGKHVLVVDDTLVRGHTMKHIVRMLRQAGAKSVHVRIGAPKIVSPCSKGVDTGRETRLPASDFSESGLRKHIGADSLEFLRLEMLESVVGKSICRACFLKA